MAKPNKDGALLMPLGVIELNGQKVDLDYYFGNEYTDINLAGLELPSLIEWVNAQLQWLYEDKLNAEQAYKTAVADAYLDLKGGTYAELYGGKPTEKALEFAIHKDEGVIAASKEVARLAGWVRRFNSLQQSLNTKLDVIRSSEATRRRLVDPAELELDRKKGREDRDGE